MKINDIKVGMTDAVTMIKDKNLKLFLRPFLVMVVVIFLVLFLHKGTSSQIRNMKKKAEAQAAELENREDFLRNKSKYGKLIEALPSNKQKSLWHASQIISIREQLKLPADAMLNGNEVQTTDGVFTLSTIPIKGEMTFEQIGRVIEAIENYPSFICISDLRISRKQGELEKLEVNFNTNTIFVQDKDFPGFTGGRS